MARHQTLPTPHGHTLEGDADLLITFDRKVVKVTQTDFEVNLIKSVGGVRQSITRENGLKLKKQFKMADFLLGLGCRSKRLFCLSRHDA